MSRKEDTENTLEIMTRVAQKRLALLPFEVAAAFNLSCKEVGNKPEVWAQVDWFSNQFIMRITHFLRHAKGEMVLDEFIDSVPVTWWDAFKARFFPVWLLKRFPAKMRDVRYKATKQLAAFFPALPVNIDQYVHVITWLDDEGKPYGLGN